MLFFPAILFLATAAVTQATVVSFNEHIERYAQNMGVGVDVVLGVSGNDSAHPHRLTRRALDWPVRHPELKVLIDNAVRTTAARPHFFWSGRIAPALSEADSVMNLARKIAVSKGGTTLEHTLDKVPMPKYDSADPDADDIWQYASDSFASESRGDTYVVKGESVRPGNVWEVYEYPRLKKSQAVKRIFEIIYRKAGPGPQRQIWPELQGCDGVLFLDKTVQCPAGAKLYYGAPKKPVVTAKTSVAKDTKIKISSSGRAAGVTPECIEIMSAEWIFDVLRKSGACDAATAKGDGGKTMTKVKALFTSAKNRNYIQHDRLLQMKSKVVGNLIVPSLKSHLLDALVAMDYYESTAGDIASITSSIDSMVSAVAGKPPGLAAAWKEKIAQQKPTKAILLAELQKQIAQKAKEANEAAKRQNACGGAAPPGGNNPASAKRATHARMVRRWSSLPPLALSSLHIRGQSARSGPAAPAAPSCPLKTAPKKTVVPRANVQTKTPPSPAPRAPATRPAPRTPNASKRVVPRPANRARRTPGKAAPQQRTTPRQKPKAVPRPANRPKGRARGRRGGRK